MKQKKKSAILTFFFSFLPGAAEMYMGFMKMGLSLMGLFFLSFMIPGLVRASDIFMGVGFLIWFYGFFHARNLAASDLTVFEQIEDRLIWEELTNGRSVSISGKTARKWMAGGLIFLGIAILWNNFAQLILNLMPEEWWDVVYPVVNGVPEVAMALILIIIGARMILGKKEMLDGRD